MFLTYPKRIVAVPVTTNPATNINFGPAFVSCNIQRRDWHLHIFTVRYDINITLSSQYVYDIVKAVDSLPVT